MADQQAETAHPPPENNTTAESTATTKPPVPNRRNPHPIPVYQRPNRAGWNASGQAGFFGLWCVICYVVLFAIEDFAGDDKWTFWFTLLFLWRYARFVINLFGWFIYRPARIPRNPYYGPEDVTVILPTIDPGGEDFAECLRTCCENNPHSIFVVTAGNRLPATEAAVQPFQAEFPQINFLVDCSPVASKRAQVALMIPRVTTAITVMLDDHVFWKRNFLRAMLAPFDADDAVGMVGTNKAVRRLPNLGFNRRFWNLIGAMYLYRHNFEVRAANAIDGGAFVISARTCALRTEIIQLPEFLEGYANEMFFFGLFGPLNPDDDNYNTRFVVKKGWKLKFQYTDDAEITTTIGVVPPYAKKFLGQATRWARTTWRSNPRSLFVERAVWAYNPISVYTVFISALTNFAIPTDLCLYYFFHWSELYTTRLRGWVPTRNHGTVLLLGWMLFAKLVKQSGYWWRHPRDFLYFPLAIGFGYFHTFIKFYAMVTFWDHAWTGRNLKAVDAGAGPGNAAGMGGDDNALANTVSGFLTNLARIRVSQQNTRQKYHQTILKDLQTVRREFNAIGSAQHGIQQNQALVTIELDTALAEFETLLNSIQNTSTNQAALRESLKRLAARINHLQRSSEEAENLLNAAPSPPQSGDSGLGDRHPATHLTPFGRGRHVSGTTNYATPPENAVGHGNTQGAGGAGRGGTVRPVPAVGARPVNFGDNVRDSIRRQFNIISGTDLWETVPEPPAPLPNASPEQIEAQQRAHRAVVEAKKQRQNQFLTTIFQIIAPDPALRDRYLAEQERSRRGEFSRTDPFWDASRYGPPDYATPTRAPTGRGASEPATVIHRPGPPSTRTVPAGTTARQPPPFDAAALLGTGRGRGAAATPPAPFNIGGTGGAPATAARRGAANTGTGTGTQTQTGTGAGTGSQQGGGQPSQSTASYASTGEPVTGRRHRISRSTTPLGDPPGPANTGGGGGDGGGGGGGESSESSTTP